MSFIVTNPDTPTRNIIQPVTGNVEALILRDSALGQTVPLLEIQNSAGVVLTAIDGTGAITGVGASPSGAVILAPSSVNRNHIQPTGDTVQGLWVQGNSPTQSAPIFRVSTSAGDDMISVIDPNGNVGISGPPGGFVVIYDGAAGMAGGLTALIINPSGGGSQVQLQGNNDADVPLLIQGNGNAQTASLLKVNKFGSSVMFEVGANGELGFFGGTKRSRQAGASAAAIASIVDPNAKAAISAIQAALGTSGTGFGLITSPA